MLIQLQVDKQRPQPKIVPQSQRSRSNKRDPEPSLAGKNASDGRSGRGRECSHHTGDTEHGSSLLGLDNRGDEGASWCLIHIVQSGAEEEQDYRHPQPTGEGEEEHGSGTRNVREHHGFDQSQFSRQGPCEDCREGGEQVAQ